MTPDAQAHWGIAYFTNSNSPRARKWYYLARLVKADGKWWELYQISIIHPTCRRLQGARAQAQQWNKPTLDGTFTRAPSPRSGTQMIWSLEDKT